MIKKPRHPALDELAAICALALIVLAVFWNGLNGGFIFDDFPNLVLDPDWKVTAGTWDEWIRATSHGIASQSGRPLALLSFGINHFLTGMDPWPMKATNLLLHTVNAVLVYQLARKLSSLSARACPTSRYFAALLALAWAIHPLQVSTTLYVVQRMEIGAATGTLLALLCYLQARIDWSAPKRRWAWLILAAMATAFGWGFKETAILVPLYALAIEIFVLRFRCQDGRYIPGLRWGYAALIGAASLVFLFILLPRQLGPEAYSIRAFSLGERLLSQPAVLLMYLQQIFAPIPQTLVFYYDHLAVMQGQLSVQRIVLGVVVLVALAAAAVVFRKRAPLASLGIAWFFIAHALTSNIFPLELAFEHRNYLALFGPLLAISQLLYMAGRRLNWDARAVAAALPVSLLVLMGWIHVNHWSEPLRLAITLSAINPESERASYGLGGLLYERSGGDHTSPGWSLAYQEFMHASRRSGSSPLPEHALIVMSARANKPIEPEIWERFESKMAGPQRAGPQHIQALHGVIECRVKRECMLDDAPLFGTIVASLEANPGSATHYTLYANFAWNVMADHELAVRLARQALEIAPRSSEFQANLALFVATKPELAADGELEALIAAIRSHNRGGRMDEKLEQIQGLKRSSTDVQTSH